MTQAMDADQCPDRGQPADLSIRSHGRGIGVTHCLRKIRPVECESRLCVRKPTQGDAQLGERAQDEVTVLCPRMRKRQLGVVADDAVEVDEVDVDGSRSVPDGSDTPEPVFDRMHPSGEIVRFERRIEYDDLVEELHRRIFGRYVDRLRFND